jgi:hypothetical protein
MSFVVEDISDRVSSLVMAILQVQSECWNSPYSTIDEYYVMWF